MYQVGEKVRVKQDTNYFGKKYEGTIAEIVKAYGIEVFEVRTYDGEIFVAHESYIEPLGWQGWRDSTKEDKNACKHPNKYKNTLSRTLSFIYCPDCKKDLGDA